MEFIQYRFKLGRAKQAIYTRSEEGDQPPSLHVSNSDEHNRPFRQGWTRACTTSWRQFQTSDEQNRPFRPGSDSASAVQVQ